MRGIKILCTALAVICVICANLPAQGGIKGGFDTSQFYSVKPAGLDQNWITGFQLGLFVDIMKPSSYVQIRPELIYIRKGTKLSFTEPYSVAKIKIDYLELPVLAQFNLLPNKTINPYIIAGPYVALRTWAKRLTENSTSIKEDIKDLVEPWDFGLIGGVGVEYKMDHTLDRILLEVRYEWGLTDIDKSTDRAKNNSFLFSVGVGF